MTFWCLRPGAQPEEKKEFSLKLVYIIHVFVFLRLLLLNIQFSANCILTTLNWTCLSSLHSSRLSTSREQHYRKFMEPIQTFSKMWKLSWKSCQKWYQIFMSSPPIYPTLNRNSSNGSRPNERHFRDVAWVRNLYYLNIESIYLKYKW